MPGPRQLLIYEFGPDADFEGRLVGALERMQVAEDSRVLDGLFVANDVETGELAAIDLRAASGTGAVARLLTFRLDPLARGQATKRALGGSGSVPAETVRELGGSLKPGGSMLALLVERPEVGDLDEAVARTGGRVLASELVDAASLAELAPKLVTVLKSRRPTG